MLTFLIATALSKVSVDAVLAGAAAAVSLYCGVKTPRNRRRRR